MDGMVFPVREGMIVRSVSEGERCLRNKSADLNLYLYIGSSSRFLQKETQFKMAMVYKSGLLSQVRLKFKGWIAIALAVSLVLLTGWLIPSRSQPKTTYPAIFEEVWQTVNKNFFDPKFNGVDWSAVKTTYAPQIQKAKDQTETANLINQMLGELKVSHTRYYTPDDPAYYQLLGIFDRDESVRKKRKPFFPKDKVEYTGIGIFTKEVDKQTFINGILEGSPAQKAGLKVGDRLSRVDGKPFQPVQSFAGKANKPVTVEVQRSSDVGNLKQITVQPKVMDAATQFLDAQRSSIQVIEQNGKKIGYIHIWSYAGDQYQRLLEDTLLDGKLKDADALVLDLRDGWGGAQPGYLRLFTSRGPSITYSDRTGMKTSRRFQWTKPVTMLVNDGSRSGKEILAYGFQRYKIGTVVGNKTAGAVVGGRAFLMKDGSLLYLAVADVWVDGDQRLEGVGVTPDVDVPFTLAYANGADPQREQAIEIAAKAVQTSPVTETPPPAAEQMQPSSEKQAPASETPPSEASESPSPSSETPPASPETPLPKP
jgi:carboxyl-terminal processing protease